MYSTSKQINPGRGLRQLALTMACTALLSTGCSSPPPATTVHQGKAIHLGDSLEWVLATHGEADQTYPFTKLDETILTFGNSFVRMKHKRVFKWENFGDLHLEPGADDMDSVNITQGSRLADILSTHGEPDEIKPLPAREEVMMIYDSSWIRMRRGMVDEWSDGGNLHVFDRELDMYPDKLPPTFVLINGSVMEYTIKTTSTSTFTDKAKRTHVIVPTLWDTNTTPVSRPENNFYGTPGP